MTRSLWRRYFQGLFHRTTHGPNRSVARPSNPLRFETLESRDVPSVMHPTFKLEPQHPTIKPDGSNGPTGYNPSQIAEAYGFNQVSENGSGTTIAIIDAYNDPSIQSDLTAFDTEFGLPTASLSVVSQTGSTTALPKSNSSWAEEISLDVEWSHAMAPEAKIMLVEATSASTANLMTAVDYASSVKGVVAVSMSWGGSESSNESTDDKNFIPPSSNPDVVYVVSAGDSGSPAEYPSASPDVLSVGGTSLTLSVSGSYSSESAWSDGGGGPSKYEAEPSWQKGVVPTSMSTTRATPDVSYDANPSTGIAVYDSYSFGTSAAWQEFGGTSCGAPQWSAIVADADSGLLAEGKSALTIGTLMPVLYSTSSSGDFHDVTTGSNNKYSAGPGYDLVTGIGTPIVNNLMTTLVGSGGGNPTFNLSSLTPTPVDAGASESFTITAENPSSEGGVDTGYDGTVGFSSSDTKAQFTIGPFTNGVANATVTFETVGTQSITATDSSNSAITGSESGIVVDPGAPASLEFVQEPTNATSGAAIAPAITVEELDKYGNAINDGSTVTLSLSPDPSDLEGTDSAVITNGVATFANVSVSATGTYTLTATDSDSSSLSATSTSFTISTSSSNVIENFTNGLGLYYYTEGSPLGASRPEVSITTAAAHPGTATEGLDDPGDGNWYFREDSGAMGSPGDTIATWIEFPSVVSGRAYFGFGTTLRGLDSVVLAPNTDQFLIQENPGFINYNNVAAASQTYAANTWYFVQIQWGTTGIVTATLSTANSSGGLTQLNSITASTGDKTSGTFAFRSIGANYFSTVTETTGGNSGNVVLRSSSGSTANGAYIPAAVSELPYLPVTWGGIPVSSVPATGYTLGGSSSQELLYITSSSAEEGWFGF